MANKIKVVTVNGVKLVQYVPDETPPIIKDPITPQDFLQQQRDRITRVQTMLQAIINDVDDKISDLNNQGLDISL